MSNFRTQVEAPMIQLVSFNNGAVSPSFEWADRKDLTLSQGGSAALWPWISVSGAIGATSSLSCTIETSPDDVNWLLLTDLTITAFTGNGQGIDSSPPPSYSGCKKALRYIRIKRVNPAAPFTAGNLRWGLS